MNKSTNVIHRVGFPVTTPHPSRFSGIISYKSLLLASCLSLTAGPLSMAHASGGYLSISMVFAGATPATIIGDTVTNPSTGIDETVVALIEDADGQVIYAVTSTGILLFTITNVGDTYRSTDPSDTNVYQIVETTANGSTGLIESVKVNLTTDIGADPVVAPNVRNVIDDQSSIFNTPPPASAEGDPAGTDFTPLPAGSGPINENSTGSRGSGGSDAYGLEICIPFIGCATIGKKGSKGSDGKIGPTVTRSVTTSHGGITANGKDGIHVTSTGGNGGAGGDSYGNISAYRGGNGGNGGTINLTNATTVETSGSSSNGITAVSRSGKGGTGGDGVLFAASGSGGSARSGGTVNITNNSTGSIQTNSNNSHGIYGLSVGGAGGSGGSGWGIVGQGGSGAAGGSGGQVNIINDALIHTRGRGSHGILGQSIGGTGGDGGDAGGIVGFGGGSSTGGAGSNVSITLRSNGEIITDGTYAIGIFGQSIGGSGGDGGAAGGIVSFGASAGSGNTAGVVTITTEAGSSITTNGDYSAGIFGQSVGGGGGSSAPTGGVVTMGGSGGGGGNGSTVNITNGSIITTQGDYSYGIFGQSVGGGGGSAAGSGGLVSLGGSGSSGGSAGNVTINNTISGVIHTNGESAHGIFGQSLGGGGGSGAASGGLVAIGGKGASGGASGTVNITNNGTIITEGLDARAIFAQSIGGGGGSGGGSGGLFAMGGNSSTGSDGSRVTVTNNGSISTLQKGADAIFAQSIGGGGGSGASSGGLVSLGGGGSGGGAGDVVTVNNSGSISTTGELARGIFAQSVGGGGGSGGHSGGLVTIGGNAGGASDANDVIVSNTGQINTDGDWSAGIFAQSVGGGGGSGGNSNGAFLTIGGKGGSGGDAGEVSVTHGGIITTDGDDAIGIVAQAIGGGGGNGGSSNSGSIFAGVAIGGDGAGGGDGDDVTITLNEFTLAGNLIPSSILTTGDRSGGILAQSVGGGGGNGGGAVQATVGTFGSVSVALGGSGSSGGEGGTVDLNGTGNVTTFGNNATGVTLQSVGGGGGNGGVTVSASLQVGIGGAAVGVALGGSSGTGGTGGSVTSDFTGAITTSGALSTGFIAQSIGGGGGNGGTAVSAVGSIGATGSAAIGVGIGGSGSDGGGVGGIVDITLDGSVTTHGDQSTAILIQSVGGGGGNGGMTVAAVGSAGGVGSGALSVGVGGEGGNGGDAGETTADIDSDVTTNGDASGGIIIQAVGGGGGNGGMTVSASASGAGVGSGAISIGVGGKGGSGGQGDIVTADYNGLLETTGDNSVGILAQSVGGGGGNGGGSITASLSGAGGGSGVVSVGLGGGGGNAGHGGRSGVSNAVTLTTAGQAVTRGENSTAIIAQSIGGGGGNGGYNISANGSGAGAGSGAVTIGLGGSGAGGGNGKGVNATVASNIWTFGDSSTGFLAQSVGGGGGNGGFNVSGSLSGAGAGSGAVAIGLGGTGGGGGVSGLVTASSSGTITTEGKGSGGFVAQSIGGGGGNGAFNVSGAASGAGIGSGGVSIGLGGSGGGAGDSGEVNATSTGQVLTKGDDSIGILAQSVGGGGGNGAFNVAAAASGAGTGSGALSVGLGGSGGSGGKGGRVSLNVTNNVVTEGTDSSGVVAQSIGGGGGNGAFNVAGSGSGAGVGSGSVSVGLGGSGGAGGDSNVVTANYDGLLETKGENSIGLLAQSVGGGGGNGAGNVAATLSGSGTGSGAVSVGLGGDGGSAGDGGKSGVDLAVTLNAAGQVVTRGDSSSGIVAQSIGGGGGNGGYNVSAGGSVSGVGSGAVTVGLGGGGSGGGAGKNVTATSTANIWTFGSDSTGFLAQSVGGGGGNGAFNVSGALSVSGVGGGAVSVGLGGSGGGGGIAGNVISSSSGSITTAGNGSAGFITQSIGGGGGNGAFNISGAASGAGIGSGAINVGLGGSGGGAASAGAVDATSSGNVVTTGNIATGILAQSVGGGGGNGAFNISGALSGAGTGSGGVSVGLGGSGGSGGHGGTVDLDVDNDVTTSGEDSTAVIAQSIGGGGGNGAFNVSGAVSGGGVGSAAASVGLGGTGGAGGDGGTVTSDIDGIIRTTGINSMGVLVQSVGGGGGNGAYNVSGAPSGSGTGGGAVSMGFGGAGGDGGLGGIVNSTVSGTVITAGENASAVVAQSIGGGGGNGGMTVAGSFSGSGTGSGAGSLGIGGSGGGGGDSSSVTNTVIATVNTGGDKSTGVLAQSVGGGGGNGAIAISGTISMAGTGSGGASAGIGGAGGDGGDSANVTNRVEGTVTTVGHDAAGIIAQSIGGGGGTGAMTIAGTFSGGGTGSGAVSVSVGGTGGGGGNSASVNNTVIATVSTDGDRSTGVLAQSVGGGGGNGGVTIAGTVSAAGTGSGAASVGVGGSGGDGGDSAAVTNRVEGIVTTKGKDAVGIIAQSIGGGGGSGGLTISGAISGSGTGSAAAAVAIGGAGGGGGDSAAVDNVVIATVTTEGENATAVLVQSVGGGGGSGGMAIAGSVSVAKTASGAASVGTGGSGGDGGHSAAVTNRVEGNVTTAGKNASGIIVQSIGGGGGSGGIAIAGAVSASGSVGGAVAVGVGGSGGGGGNSDAVTNTVIGQTVTAGDDATGILVQSIGGGGGNGGMAISAALSIAKTGSGAVSVGVGGSGGAGGDSAIVSNNVDGSVFTNGRNASGIVVQSIGGGGGNGGLTVAGAISAAKSGSGAVSVGVGSSGGDGGLSAAVTNVVSGYVQTQGDLSTGILTQSIGGGGGNGGLSTADSLSGAKTGSGALAVAIGGVGGGGGNGANATSNVTGGVITTGNKSTAILTQSVGGSGGNGGISIAGSLNLSKENGGAVAVGVGGFGGDGGDAMSVSSTVATTVINNIIGTKGDDSTAIIAQSIGGGGGNGGTNVSGSINLAGKSGAAIAVGVGGFGGDGGDASEVTLNVTGNVITEGNNSHGLLAQSVGGGGGNGGTNVSGTLNITKSGTGGSVAIGVGGFGGSGGNAGNVDVTYAGTILAKPRTFVPAATDPSTGVVTPEHYITKDGEGSHGILAQSIGGGGGNGGTNVSGALSFASSKNGGDGHALVVGVGGFGGGGGNAGTVDVTVNGGNTITAFGQERSGIMAQSVGGGGGNGAFNFSGGIVTDAPVVFGVGGLGGDGGTSDEVTVNATTDIVTTGKKSYGILAQSIGGGGGNGGLNISGSFTYNKEKNIPAITVGLGGFGGAGNVSDDVNVTHSGTITTEGESAHGIYAQSIAGGGGDGGYNFSLGLALADSSNSGGNKDVSIVAGIGGHGGTGADAGQVTVTSSGQLTTKGDHARGIFAQSIGGGGGNGGLNFSGNVAQNSSLITMGIGGFGSGGGHANTVTVNRGLTNSPAGTISTDGEMAHGIEASSIGGGGGDAGMNLVVGFSKAGSNGGSGGGAPAPREHPQHTGVDSSVFTNYDNVLNELEGRDTPDSESAGDSGESAFAVQIAIGGAGGGSGDGDIVTVNNIGDIVTNKKQSYGILAQSIGGGGGNAYINIAATYIASGNRNKGFNLALGGATGNGGFGSIVTVDHLGAIETFGVDSYGILAQSIGGGGGNAGLDFAYAKADGGKIGISLGRRGGTGGFGNDVTINAAGSVVTHGEGAHALLGQSIGNGGGNSSSRSISGEIASSDANAPNRGASVAIGLEGGVGGAAGDVTITAQDWVSTDGDNAYGIFAQSVGGGGGNGGSATGFGITTESANLTMGGSGGQGGTGGKIHITNTAQVQTMGKGSIGIIGQSIGGGGGNGGMARDILLNGAGTGARLTMGGTGGTGSFANDVTIINNGVIVTKGEGAYGVMAQSLGGGGGNGGMTINALRNKTTDKGTQIAIAIGGDGGTGAKGGAVNVTNRGSIGTSGRDAIGIFAQSIGGGGGNAKQVITASLSSAGAGNKISIGLGGTGGTGGTGGSVNVNNMRDANGTAGVIITAGTGAHGILAMSIGGGGGTGSTVITSNVSLKAGNKSPTNSLAFSLGGNGGTGGTGGEVTVTNDIRIATYGQKSHGIIAQSIGGGGGNGGMSLSGNMVFGNNVDSTNAIAIAIGGTGGSGNTSRNVTVTNSGEIEVFGNGSYGVFAQSVGGGGGNGAFALALSSDLLSNPKTNPGPMFMNFGLGGAGGDGADSGDVIVNHTGSITAHGDDSYGIFAQSVAGGGGTVGFAISSPVWMATNAVVPLILGSRAGGSGTAGNVTVNTEGNITMLGNNSHAYLAQSVNGGGGNANLFLDFSQTARALGEDSVDIDDGSDQNGGGSGELAYIQAKIELGAKATGITAAGDFIATHTGNLITLGKNAFGSSTQSVGGGGGNANVDVAINEDAQAELDLLIGSQDTHNSGGGDITYQRTGDVGTTGDNSKGTSVQSIGGGGGDMIIAVRIVPDTPETSNTSGAQSAQVTSQVSGKTTQSVHKSQTTAKVAQDFEQTLVTAPSSINDSNASTLLAMGADSSLNNNGGAIILDFTGDTQTLGDRAPGMIIQSIGGGGGDVRLSGIENLSATFGGTGGTTGNGGNITLNNTGDILTTGTLSHGMVLQTIGGGGGTVLTDLAPENIGISTRSDNSGSGGDITFAQTGDITASGDRSIALLAQSLGGGGGILDRVFMNSAGGAGTSGNITLNIDGSMIATGTQGVAVFAQSIGADDQGDININLTQDKWMRGGTNGAGLWISGGNDNRFINHGIVITEDLVNGMAAYATTGNDRIDNYNLFYGRFDLGTGNNHFINHTGATFVPGSSLSLGSASNMLINDGTMLIADMGLAQRTDLTGSFTQSADALTYSELDFETGQLDQIRATGTVDVAGEVRLSLLNPHKIKSGDYSKILFSGELGLTNNGLILTTGSSRVLTYELLFPNATDATLHYEVNFAPAELGSNLSTMGNYFNSLQDAGSSPEMADVVSALLYIQDDDQFREALSQLSPDFYGEQQSKLMGNNARFGQSMMSCRQFGGEHHFTSEGNCVWIQAETEKTIHNAYGDFKASSASLNRFSVGMQKTYSHVWSLGFAASKSDTQAQGYNGNWNSSGRTTQLGLSMKYRTGGTKLAAVMSYGWNNTVTHRRGQLVGNFFTSVDRDLQVIGGLLRLSHDFDAHNRYFRPFIDFGLTHVMVKDATETGGGAISLVLPGHNETHTFFRPGMEIGTEHKLSQNIKLRFFANFSLQHNLSDSSTQAVAGFVGAPTSLDPMSVTIEVGQDMFQIQTGMDFIMPDNLSLRFQYSTTLHQQIKIRSGKVKLSLPF